MKRVLLLALVAVLVPVATYSASLLFSATPPEIDWKSKDVQQLVLFSNTSLTFAKGKPGSSYTLIVKQDSTGARSITWPTNVHWPNGVAPVLTSTPNATDIIEFLFDGEKYLGSFKLNFAGSPPPPPPTTLSTGLTHYWKLDEASGNAIDSVGTLTLTNNNSATYVSGFINNAANFVRNNTQYLKTTTDIHPTTLTSYSVSFWVNQASQPSEGEIQTWFVNSDAPGSFEIRYDNALTPGTKQIQVRQFSSSGGQYFINHNINLNTSAWYFITLTWDGTQIQLYVNGVAAENPTAINSIYIEPLNGGLGIGLFPANLVHPLDGKIDEVGFWARALNSSEVTQLYNAGAGRTYPF